MPTISYKEGKIIGRGGFGVVREAVGSNGKLVFKTTNHSRSLHEYRIYSKLEGIPGIPKVISIEERDGFFVMLMENAGVDIYQLFRVCDFWDSSFWLAGQRCYLVAVLAYQVLTVLQSIHSRGVIHGDVQPSNFTFTMPSQKSELAIRLIDFGASIDEDILGEDEAPSQINYCFASVQRIKSQYRLPSKADDLVSLGYTLLFLLRGHLPWSPFMNSSGKVENLEALVLTKMAFGADSLCQGLPFPFRQFMSYTLGFEKSPDSCPIDYNKYIRAFRRFSEQGFAKD